jgi:hypothetical protein
MKILLHILNTPRPLSQVRVTFVGKSGFSPGWDVASMLPLLGRRNIDMNVSKLKDEDIRWRILFISPDHPKDSVNKQKPKLKVKTAAVGPFYDSH